MSTVTPPSTPLPQPSVALPRAIVLNASAQLLNLGTGAKIEAVVSQLIDTSQIRLTTNFGDVTIRLPTRVPVTIGQPLLLQLQGGGEQPKVQISAPNGQPLLTGGGNSSPAVVASAPSSTSHFTAPATQQIVPDSQITATLLRPLNVTPNLTIINAATANSQNGPAPASRVATPGTPATQSANTTQTSAQAGSAAQGSAQGSTTAGSGSAPSTAAGTVIPSGSSLTLKIVSLTIPEAPNTTPSTPKTDSVPSVANGSVISGIVTGKQGVSQTVVQTHVGPISLPTGDPLPRGTQITFEVTQLNIIKGVENHDLTALRPFSPATGGTWPTLADTLDALGDISPAAQAQILQAALPRADAQLSTNILFFLAALRGGDLKGWVGDGPLRILERQRPDLAGRLRDDMGQLSRQIDDPETGEWRMHTVPYLNNEEVDRIRMLVRDSDSDDDDGNSNDGSRFVIDLNLTRLGHLQIDGLVGNGGKRVDVVLRSDAPLSGKMRDDIRQLYANAIEVTGIDGSVGFQAAPAKFINIPEPAPDSTDGMVV